VRVAVGVVVRLHARPHLALHPALDGLEELRFLARVEAGPVVWLRLRGDGQPALITPQAILVLPLPA